MPALDTSHLIWQRHHPLIKSHVQFLTDSVQCFLSKLLTRVGSCRCSNSTAARDTGCGSLTGENPPGPEKVPVTRWRETSVRTSHTGHGAQHSVPHTSHSHDAGREVTQASSARCYPPTWSLYRDAQALGPRWQLCLVFLGLGGRVPSGLIFKAPPPPAPPSALQCWSGHPRSSE